MIEFNSKFPALLISYVTTAGKLRLCSQQVQKKWREEINASRSHCSSEKCFWYLTHV